MAATFENRWFVSLRNLHVSKLPATPTLQLADLVPQRHVVAWRSLPASRQMRFTHSGRAGIYQYLRALKRATPDAARDVVLVPAFQCPTVVDPVLHAGCKVRFYAITENLQVDQADFLRKLDRSVGAALFIRYFGIGGIPAELIVATRNAGAKVIHDCSHSFLDSAPLGLAGAQADAAIYSFWKLLPSSAVGGGVWCTDEAVNRCWPEQTAAPLRQRLKLAKQLLVELKDNLLHSTSAGELTANDGAEPAPEPVVRKPYAEAYPYDRQLAQAGMPGLARHVLHCADLQRVAELRRQHYETFVAHLADHSQLRTVFTKLAAGDVPWGVPVILQRRYERDYLLRARGVPIFSFGEVLHPLLFQAEASEPEMVAATRYLSENLLGIAVHQQLRTAMMRDYAQITNRFLAELV